MDTTTVFVALDARDCAALRAACELALCVAATTTTAAGAVVHLIVAACAGAGAGELLRRAHMQQLHEAVRRTPVARAVAERLMQVTYLVAGFGAGPAPPLLYDGVEHRVGSAAVPAAMVRTSVAAAAARSAAGENPTLAALGSEALVLRRLRAGRAEVHLLVLQPLELCAPVALHAVEAIVASPGGYARVVTLAEAPVASASVAVVSALRRCAQLQPARAGSGMHSGRFHAALGGGGGSPYLAAALGAVFDALVRLRFIEPAAGAEAAAFRYALERWFALPSLG